MTAPIDFKITKDLIDGDAEYLRELANLRDAAILEHFFTLSDSKLKSLGYSWFTSSSK